MSQEDFAVAGTAYSPARYLRKHRVCMTLPNIREEEKGKDLPRVETTTLASHKVAAIAMMIFFLFQMAIL